MLIYSVMATQILGILVAFPAVASEEAPFTSLDQKPLPGWTSQSSNNSLSNRRFSRARIDTPVCDEEERLSLTSQRLEDEGWTRRDLDVRSTEYVQEQNGARRSPHFKLQNELQLHLEQRNSADEKARVGTSTSFTDQKKSFKKTGTTIAGCVCRGHVILAADTRATQNTIVADKVAQKLHPLAQNAWCAGAGTSADLEMTTRLCLYTLALDQLKYNSIGNDEDTIPDLVATFTTPAKQEENNSLLIGKVSLGRICSFLQDRLWKGQGNLGVNLILGCVDQGEAHLRALHPHGSMDVDLPFAALGSGGLAAMSIMECGYNQNLTVSEAKELVQSAIIAGIQNDLGSGSQVDICIILPDGTSQMTRCVVPSRVLKELDYSSADDEPRLSAEDSAGTNGFGNTPFGIKSKRTIVSAKQEKRLGEWLTLLGIEGG